MVNEQVHRVRDRLIAIAQQLRGEEDGVNLVIVALLMVTLLGFAGLGIDGSNVFYQRQRVQIAADAAAMGGARLLAIGATTEQVDTTIQHLARENGADSATWNYINDGRGVHVEARRTFDAFFAQIYGMSTFDVFASAEAQYEPVTGADGLFPLTLPCDCVDEDGSLTVGDPGGDGGDGGDGDDDGDIDDEAPISTIIEFDGVENNSYEISLVNYANNTWTYQIRENLQTTGGMGDLLPMTINCSTPLVVGQSFQAWDKDKFAPGSFGWLDWNGGSRGNPELVDNILHPINSGYWNIGDKIPTGPGVQNSSGVESALDTWIGKAVAIPLHDQVSGNGANTVYRVCGFAQFILTGYNFQGSDKWVSGQFLGYLTPSGSIQPLHLTYWSLGITTCLSKVSSSLPAGEIGDDGAGFVGIRWTLEESFAVGEFSFTLNGSYPAGIVDAKLVAGQNAAIAQISGPICDGSSGGSGGSSGDTGSGGVTPALCLPIIDFESSDAGASLVRGQIIDNEWAAWGVQVTTNNPGSHPAMIFDTASPTGGDFDLGSPHQSFGGPGIGVGGAADRPGKNSNALGKVLIISEDNNASNPDDNANGGTIIFTFGTPVRIDEVHILDIDDKSAAGYVRAYNAISGGSLIKNAPMLGLGDNSFQVVEVKAVGVRRLEINLPKGGAVPAIVSCSSQALARYNIGDRIWFDADFDGIQDVGELGLPGVVMELYLEGGTELVASTVTNDSGEYLFMGLPAGTYEVKVADSNFAGFGPLAGALNSPKDATSDDLDSDFNSATQRATVTLPLNGGHNMQADGGFMLPQPAPYDGEQGPTTVTVALNDNKDSQYKIEFIERDGRTWKYKVTEVKGRDLSHWNLGGETSWNCIGHIVSYTPGGASIGRDGSTGFWGIKWDVNGNFTSGIFSFTLDNDYAYKTVKAQAKAGPSKASTHINGPDCSTVVQDVTPTPMPSPTPVPSTTPTPEPDPEPDPEPEPNACVFRWLDWNGGTTSYTELRNDMLDTSRSGVRVVGDEIAPGPPASGDALVSDGMNANIGKVLLIPLANWDGDGYVVCGFARIRLLDYDFSSTPRWVSFEYVDDLVRGLITSPTAPDYGARDVVILK